MRYHPRHVVHPSNLTLEECLAISDVVISAVPSTSFKVKTEWLKDGCVCLNVAAEKNFEKDVRDKVKCPFSPVVVLSVQRGFKASIYIPAVGKVTILMLLRNLYVCHTSIRDKSNIRLWQTPFAAIPGGLEANSFRCLFRDVEL